MSKNIWKTAFEALIETPDVSRRDPYYVALQALMNNRTVEGGPQLGEIEAWLNTPVPLGQLYEEQGMAEHPYISDEQMVYRVIFTGAIFEKARGAKASRVTLRGLQGWRAPAQPVRINGVVARWWTRLSAGEEDLERGFAMLLPGDRDDGMDLV